jgi:nucleotide-binding universal stress UspA family protein
MGSIGGLRFTAPPRICIGRGITMKRFKNILVIHDNAIGGEDALGQAVALARENAARLTIAAVLREEQPETLIADETRKRLTRLVTSLRQDGLDDVGSAILTGIPFLEITRRVIREGHDLVITSAEAGKVLRDVFFGSTATHLMRKCPCPVWVVKPAQPVPHRQILAAVDTKPSDTDDHLNVKIMDLATSLASHDHATLHIVHAWDVEGGDADTVRSEISPHQRQVLVRQHKRSHHAALKDLLARYPMTDIDYQVHLPRDLPERAICNLVKREKIDLIVMGTVVRTGIPGFFIGNAAESVLGSVKCSMLTVKPDGFKFPVLLPHTVAGGAEGPESARDPMRQSA